MSYDSGDRWTARTAVPQVDVDVGLRQSMLRVYNYMAGGLALTGIVAYLSQGVYQQYIIGTPLYWVVLLAPLGLVMVLSFGIQRMSLSAAQLTFWAYSPLMGLWFAGIFLLFTTASIARVFSIPARALPPTSIYGET